MTKEQYQDPKTPIIEKFFYYYTINGGSLSSFADFNDYFTVWVNMPIVKLHYPLHNIKNRVINALNKHFEL